MHIRVLTLNVWNTQGDPRRISLINRELQRLRPDLVSFQEVVARADTDQLAALIEGTGLNGTHQRDVMRAATPYADYYGGLALATRWPHVIVETIDPRIAGAMDVPWCTLAARVSLPLGDDLLFIATSGSWRPEAEFAREQLALGLSDLDARHRQKLPTIIAGDFNASPEAASMRFLHGRQSLNGRSAHYHDIWTAAERPGFTWTTDNPLARGEVKKALGVHDHHARIDHILVGSRGGHPDVTIRIETASLVLNTPIDGIWLSDHFGVMSDIALQIDG